MRFDGSMKFGGKYYTHADTFEHPALAKTLATALRLQGYNVRVHKVESRRHMTKWRVMYRRRE